MKSMIIAPHPDDEVLGAGGTFLRLKDERAKTAWVIVSQISEDEGWSTEKIDLRNQEIEEIRKMLKFDDVYKLGFPAAKLDVIPISDLVSKISDCIKSFEPEEIYLPHPCDAHSDHRIVFEAAASCTKSFRYPFIKKVYAYETLSETETGLNVTGIFKPNTFVNIDKYLEGKLKAMNVYKSELGDFPFPRSNEAITALAKYRGASSGFEAAECFEMLRERL